MSEWHHGNFFDFIIINWNKVAEVVLDIPPQTFKYLSLLFGMSVIDWAPIKILEMLGFRPVKRKKKVPWRSGRAPAR